MSRSLGIIMVIVSATLWGLSGTAAQRLFQVDGISPGWLVEVRMGLSGVALLAFTAIRQALLSRAAGAHGENRSANVWAIWRHPVDRWRVLVFGLLGLAVVQYTYFAAIRYGNAATATFLQYVGPSMVSAWIALRARRWPRARENAALLAALVGTFLLVTNGSVRSLTVPPAAVIWGLLAAVSLAFYTLYPGSLLRTWGPSVVVGWGMLAGALSFVPFVHPWDVREQHWSTTTVWLVLFVIFFGTLLAFTLFLGSLHLLSPAEASILASAEPLSAAIAAVLWLHVQLGPATLAGGACILATVLLLARKSSAEPAVAQGDFADPFAS